MTEQKSLDISGSGEVGEKFSELWLTEKQVVLLIGFSLSTLQKNRHEGKGIPYSKIGRLVRYSMSDVIRYMNAHKIDFS